MIVCTFGNFFETFAAGLVIGFGCASLFFILASAAQHRRKMKAHKKATA